MTLLVLRSVKIFLIKWEINVLLIQSISKTSSLYLWYQQENKITIGITTKKEKILFLFNVITGIENIKDNYLENPRKLTP